MPFGNPDSHRAMYRKRLETMLLPGSEPDDAVIDRSLDVYLRQPDFYDEWFKYYRENAISLLELAVVKAEQQAEQDALNAQAYADAYDMAHLENAIRDFVRQY